jgi:hypothetical protein
MAKKTKNQTPSEASTPKRCKPSPSIVTPTKIVTKGKSKDAATTKHPKTASSVLSSSSPLLSSFSLPPSSPSLLSSPLPVTTAPSLSNKTTPKKKKVNHATLPPGLLAKLSHQLKTGNFEDSLTLEKNHITKIKLKHFEIDWLNPEVILSECTKYLKKNKSLPSTHESQLLFLMNKFESGQIKLSFSNAFGKMGHTATKLFYPLPGRKEKIVSRFIQLILSIMIYSIRKTVM